MSFLNKPRFHRIYGIILSITLCVAGILLMYACAGIYLSGDKAFTPEAVAAAFSTIAVPVYLCIALIIGGLVLNRCLPQEQMRLRAPKQADVTLDRLRRKFSPEGCDRQVLAKINAEQKARKLRRGITLLLLCVCSIGFLLYGANPANWHQSQINTSMVTAVLLLGASLALPLAMAIFTFYANTRSMEREYSLLKQEMTNNPNAVASQPAKKTFKKTSMALRWAILGIAVAVLLFGFFTGGTNDVLTKAINICTECVGLG